MSYRLGAYEADVTIEIFEECGYVRYKDLDSFFDDCYFDFETKLTREKFIKISKENLMRDSKYKQFINNEVKICPRCGFVKPLDSFTNDKRRLDGKAPYCRDCKNEYQRDRYNSSEESKKAQLKANKEYASRNPEKVNAIKRKWEKNNKQFGRIKNRRVKMRRNLKKFGFDKDFTIKEIDKLVSIKMENNIKLYADFFERFEGVING